MSKKNGTEPILELVNTYKSYQMGETQVNALKNISLQIKKGDFVSIVGPSGSGKSTLMHIIGLLDQPSSGQVFLKGRETQSLDEKALSRARNHSIGFIFQQFNLLPKTSARENVELPMLYAGLSQKEREKRATAILEKVALGDRLDHHPNQLSGGQQQRVAIARALVNDPEIILADEPTGNLDSRSGVEIVKLIKEINREGKTIVMVTHDQELARRANRVITMIDGQINN